MVNPLIPPSQSAVHIGITRLLDSEQTWKNVENSCYRVSVTLERNGISNRYDYIRHCLCGCGTDGTGLHDGGEEGGVEGAGDRQGMLV
jgi:hypothetical protein